MRQSEGYQPKEYRGKMVRGGTAAELNIGKNRYLLDLLTAHLTWMIPDAHGYLRAVKDSLQFHNDYSFNHDSYVCMYMHAWT